ncbi:hypothetical protein PHYPSEUDO_011871 [Phytophthora pseudosyringae]|uniref:Uncharacterized protein n=1 Tax=Phytophthora pseudosyringae TaxID=221518 RepID=A0A8T1VAK3_9STRA|nr:hypothetical protein PHYPSEUDO_011871 [Phytophthora pseudosyringae]
MTPTIVPTLMKLEDVATAASLGSDRDLKDSAAALQYPLVSEMLLPGLRTMVLSVPPSRTSSRALLVRHVELVRRAIQVERRVIREHHRLAALERPLLAVQHLARADLRDLGVVLHGVQIERGLGLGVHAVARAQVGDAQQHLVVLGVREVDEHDAQTLVRQLLQPDRLLRHWVDGGHGLGEEGEAIGYVVVVVAFLTSPPA